MSPEKPDKSRTLASHDMVSFSITINGRPWRARLVRSLPRYWVPLHPPGRVLAGRRLFTWPYVLQALRLPYRLCRFPEPVLVVPALVARLAATNLAEFDEEEAHPPVPVRHPEQPHAWLTCLVILPLVLVHVLTGMAASLPGLLPLPATRQAWLDLCSLDCVRVLLFGEWSRCITALFLHQDAGHLAANAAFSLLFCRLLGNRTGFGLALVLTIWTGALANAVTVPLREGPVTSLGFSTALFAAIGSLSGFASHFSRPQAFLPLACGAGLLALLGSSGENTDYMAHVAGLLCGMLTGWAAALLTARHPQLFRPFWQTCFLAAAFLLPPAGFVLRLLAP